MVDGRTEGQTDRQTDKPTRLLIPVRGSLETPKTFTCKAVTTIPFTLLFTVVASVALPPRYDSMWFF